MNRRIEGIPRRRAVWRSLGARLAVLLIAFLVAPLLIYQQLYQADAERQALLLETVRDRGLLISRALDPVLRRADSVPFVTLGEELARFASPTVNLKLLFQPEGPDGQPGTGFFYVASEPPVSVEALEAERSELLMTGVLGRLAESCRGDLPLALRMDLPGGRTELLTSVSPMRTPRGCWALVVSRPLTGEGRLTVGLPYWQTREVQMAAAIYLAFTVLVLGMFLLLWRGVIRFGRLARSIRGGGETGSFSARTRLPELAEVAADFDSMVARLREAAVDLRRAAEEKAHAFRAPIGTLRQATDLLDRRIPEMDGRGRAALSASSRALDRLERLVQAMRRLEGSTADILAANREVVDLSALTTERLSVHGAELAAGGPRLEADIPGGIRVLGAGDLLATVLDNLIENAISFTPDGGAVRVTLHREARQVALVVEDDGPGVPPQTLPRIFERHFSSRPAEHGAGPECTGRDAGAGNGHFGLGLWIVRRNVEALGGRVTAENRPTRGLRVRVELPMR